MSYSTEPLGGASLLAARRWSQRDRPILAYGFMLLTAVSLLLNYFIKFPTFPDEAAARFRSYCDGKLPLQIETSDAMMLERHFAAAGIPLAVRKLDPARYSLKGGRVERLLNRRNSWCVYQGPGNTSFVFQVFPGKTEELPAGSEIVRNDGVTFYTYLRQGTTAVFWQEQHSCCLLISDAASNEVIQLARISAEV